MLENRCHRLPLSRNSVDHDKRVIVKFFNRKNKVALLKDKKQISGKNFGHLQVTNKVFVIQQVHHGHVFLYFKVCLNNTH